MKKLYISLILLIVGGFLAGLFFDGYLFSDKEARPFPMFTIILSMLSALIANRIYSDMQDEEL